MRDVDALGHALVHHYGIKKGDRVGIAMRNLPEWIVSFAAILSVGAISVSLNAWWTEDELDYAIEDSGLSLLIADPERIDAGPCACAARGRARSSACASTSSSRSTRVSSAGTTSWSAATPMPEVEVTPTRTPRSSTRRARPDSPRARSRPTGRSPDRHGLLVAAPRSRRRAAARTRRAAARRPCFILIVPLFHVTGCVPVMLSCFAWHFKLVMMHRWDPERALQLIERHQVTTFVGVPTQTWDMLESPSFAKYDTSSLAAVGGGGAPAPAKLVDRVEKVVQPGPSQPRLRHDRDQRLRAGQQRRRLRHPPDLDRPGPTIVMDVEIRDEDATPVPSGRAGRDLDEVAAR